MGHGPNFDLALRGNELFRLLGQTKANRLGRGQT